MDTSTTLIKIHVSSSRTVWALNLVLLGNPRSFRSFLQELAVFSFAIEAIIPEVFHLGLCLIALKYLRVIGNRD